MSLIEQIRGQLPTDLAERVRLIKPANSIAAREFVLYWMRTAVRAYDNPALESAICLANELHQPLLVYHALSERYPYASDRHHTFILEGARDVQQQFAARQLPYAFHLEQAGVSPQALVSIGERASLVVIDEMPVDPLRRWQTHLARSINAPVLGCDASCVVPMRLVKQAHERAYEFRNATTKLREDRCGHQFEAIDYTQKRDLPSLPFTPVDLQTSSIPALVAACEIDHTIPAVLHTRGGSQAGYARWEAFKQSGLTAYHRKRNDVTTDGVSRMSAYLHYGMVSPFRLARDAQEHGSDGAEKFLDELLIWRELAYSFCFYRADHNRTSALPPWASQTLAKHEVDERPSIYSWEQLARARTDDELWNAAQYSLLVHGEIHNNVRMTWGKALLSWTPNAATALALLVDLNHRYALDGRDPASYGGILWCLGQFDRPFEPESTIIGTVRPRPTTQQAKRIDVPKYRRHTHRPMRDSLPRVAIIGAGLSGAICARSLADHQIPVTIFEKSRGAGGRMATRRHGEQRFDHGAQYFTVRDKRFRKLVKSWQQDGHVEQWDGRVRILNRGRVDDERRGADRYVGTPSMNSICKHLVQGLELRTQHRVTEANRVQDHWQLADDDGSTHGPFDVVVSSAPAPQTMEILGSVKTIRTHVPKVELQSCWALMLELSEPIQLPFDGAFIHDSPLSWAARNSHKPQRPSGNECWVVHGSPDWSDANLELSADQVAPIMLSSFEEALGGLSLSAERVTAHRWRYAIPTQPLEQRCLFDDEVLAGACGDWCGGPRVEGAFLSGTAMAGRIFSTLQSDREFSHITPRDEPPEQQTLF